MSPSLPRATPAPTFRPTHPRLALANSDNTRPSTAQSYSSLTREINEMITAPTGQTQNTRTYEPSPETIDQKNVDMEIQDNEEILLKEEGWEDGLEKYVDGKQTWHRIVTNNALMGVSWVTESSSMIPSICFRGVLEADRYFPLLTSTMTIP